VDAGQWDRGQITGQRVNLSDGQFLATRVLLSSLPIQVRDRGGPVVNDDGKLVGVCCEPPSVRSTVAGQAI
jgi:hypothetical protein